MVASKSKKTKVEVKKEEPLYVRKLWKDIVPVFKCSLCGHFENAEDDIIMHVVSHYDDHAKEAILATLLKEDEHD